MKVSAAINRIALLATFCWIASAAGVATAAGDAPVDGATAIAPGTTITMANWGQYKDFMPETMIGLFAGKYSWKMPDDVRMVVGPTVLHPLPKNYLAATEKYSSQVQLVELPDGGLSIANYHGGIPFPNPAEPHKGWKTLANLWYRYIPHLTVDSYGSGCAIIGSGNFNCQYYVGVKRQLAWNTDTDAPPEAAGPDARYFTEWFMTVEPEQDKYTAYLTVNYADPSRPEEAYAFLPALRRYQAISTAARCSPSAGMDATYEDFHNGFDSNLTELDVDYVGQRKLLGLVDAVAPSAPFPGDVLDAAGLPDTEMGGLAGARRRRDRDQEDSLEGQRLLLRQAGNLRRPSVCLSPVGRSVRQLDEALENLRDLPGKDRRPRSRTGRHGRARRRDLLGYPEPSWFVRGRAGKRPAGLRQRAGAEGI